MPARKPSTICRNGHDKTVVGVYAGNHCKVCKKASIQRYKQSPAGRASKRRSNARYRASAKGQATEGAYRHRTRAERAVDKQRWQRGPSGRAWKQRRRERLQYDQAFATAQAALDKVWKDRYRQKPQAKVRALAQDQKRRARKRQAFHEPYDASAVVTTATHCGICRKRYRADDPRSLDHIIPLALGGADALWNVQSAHSFCNKGKQARLAPQAQLTLGFLGG